MLRFSYISEGNQRLHKLPDTLKKASFEKKKKKWLAPTTIFMK